MDFTPVINQVLAYAVVALVTGISTVLMTRTAALRSKVPQSWDWVLSDIAAIGVKAAQQLFKGADNTAAFAFAANFLVAGAAKAGIPLSESAVQGLIEAAYFDLKQEIGKQTPPPPTSDTVITPPPAN